jgi:hypothetical protein
MHHQYIVIIIIIVENVAVPCPVETLPTDASLGVVVGLERQAVDAAELWERRMGWGKQNGACELPP